MGFFDLLYFFQGNLLIPVIALVVVYGLVIYFGIIRSNQKQRELYKKVSPEAINLFVEYRRWVPVWGLLVDGQKENQKLLDHYNNAGWRAVQYVRATFNFSLFRILGLVIISTMTLGFMQYVTGDGFLFERNRPQA